MESISILLTDYRDCDTSLALITHGSNKKVVKSVQIIILKLWKRNRKYMISKQEKLLCLFAIKVHEKQFYYSSNCVDIYLSSALAYLPIFLQNVHHAGQPMPGEEQEDIVMTSTQCNLLNVTCPLSGKPVTELAQPVRRYIATKDFFMKNEELDIFLLLLKNKSAHLFTLY